ncbi:hypothetical protein C6N40_12915 [Arenimonas caeni]|uniref:Teneurin-like YD-shell domain-containing protein n=1 Tax=Arenimonas caeni TaxID=2058085 RepID=A0A2P6M5X4_9GAMM|nr:hypothetical protein C6N40_12915 [Arenimonas caeni]
MIDDSYDYDANGNVAAISDGLPGQPGNRDMAYDELDRLVSVIAGAAQGGNGSFAYDPLDNLRVLDQGSRQFRYHYDADNRLAQIKSPTGALLHSFGYDARGNTTSKDSGTLTLDLENRLTESRLPGYQSYVYDGLARRVRERADATSTYFYYSHEGKLLYTNDHKTNTRTDHIYLSGSLVAARRVPFAGGSGEVIYQHTDALGTPVAFTDAAGNVTRRERMTAWGEPADGTWSNEPGYTGHQMDASSKLVYMQQRYYDPAVGRFLSVDPVTALDSGDMRHLNRYAYAYNNPLRFVDPDGRRGGEARARADRQRQYEEAQGDESKRDSFVKRAHERGGLGGVEPTYRSNEKDLGSWDSHTGEKSIGPGAFDYPNAEDVGSVIYHEGRHEVQSNEIADNVQLNNSNANTVLQDEAYRGELSDSNPVRGGMSERYRQDTETKRIDNRSKANATNRAIIDAGGSCRTSFCGGD